MRCLVARAMVGLAAFAISEAAALPAAAQQVPQSAEQVRLSFAPLVKKAAPAVVNIYATRVVQGAVSPLFDDPFFRRFFGPGFPGTRPERQTSLGSGVIVGPQRYIVTNHHVIRGGNEIVVVLSDRREFQAEVVLSDERTDLALLRLKDAPSDLPYLEVGDSDRLEVGDLVLAIGNPFGVGQTVTSGIVSAVARTQVGVSDYRFFIQTDAAINPGNSGGALIDLSGKLVGIPTAIYSRSGGSQGIGFAIPSTMVQAVLTSVGKGGRLVRAWLGASGQPVTSEIATSLGLAKPGGVLVNSVAPAGPAARAGIKVGDVVLSVAGHEVEDPEALRFRIATLPVGGKADLVVFRGGRELALKVSLEPPPEIPPRDETTLGGNTPLTGATVANLSPAVADELSLDTSLKGVVITGVREASPAAQVGFRPGDIVVAINGQRIGDVRVLRQLLAGTARGWQVTLQRNGQTVNLAFTG